MDQFKVRQGIAPIYPISDKTVERALGRRAPYYKENADKSKSYFAVCPCCDNPIQLIGIFRDTTEAGRKPYGRHSTRSIPHLAEYNEADYLDCPYSNSNWSSGQQRRPGSRIAQETLSILKTQFDRVIYVLEQDIDLQISLETAQKMLQSYLANKGWLYRDATPNNLPWKFGQAADALKLYGRKVKVGSALEQALRENCPEVELISLQDPHYVKVAQNGKQYVDLWYFLYGHRMWQEEEQIKEDITFRVYRGENRTEAVFEKEIQIQSDYFMNLIAKSRPDGRRYQLLLDIAANEIK